MKKVKKQIMNKDIVKNHEMIHHTVAARMEGKAKNANLRSKHGLTQIQKPKKGTKKK